MFVVLSISCCLFSCRLRKKCYKSPSMIYDDDKVFDTDGISIIPNMDIFLEILSGMVHHICRINLFSLMHVLFAVVKQNFLVA